MARHFGGVVGEEIVICVSGSVVEYVVFLERVCCCPRGAEEVVRVLGVAMRLPTAFHMQVFETRLQSTRNFPEAWLHLTSLHSPPAPRNQVPSKQYLTD